MEQSKPTVSREDYLKLDNPSDIRHQFYQGGIFALTGGIFNHALISGQSQYQVSTGCVFWAIKSAKDGISNFPATVCAC